MQWPVRSPFLVAPDQAVLLVRRLLLLPGPVSKKVGRHSGPVRPE